MSTSIAVVRTATGRVVTFVRPDLPVGWQPPSGCHTVSADQLAAGWQYEVAEEPPPIEDTLAGVPVSGSPGAVTIGARVITSGDVQVPDPERGIVLRDELGHDWLLCIAGGSATVVQISSSPEVPHAVRTERIAAARTLVKGLVNANKAKGKSKLTTNERLDAIEAALGIKY